MKKNTRRRLESPFLSFDCIQGAELECVINDLFLSMHSALWAVHLKLKPITPMLRATGSKLRSGFNAHI
jgi:hypothetical protein